MSSYLFAIASTKKRFWETSEEPKYLRMTKIDAYETIKDDGIEIIYQCFRHDKVLQDERVYG